jgi:hypothetical protein
VILQGPEIYIEVDAVKYDQTSTMLDVLFLLPVKVTRPQDIPKTKIYMNERNKKHSGHCSNLSAVG